MSTPEAPRPLVLGHMPGTVPLPRGSSDLGGVSGLLVREQVGGPLSGVGPQQPGFLSPHLEGGSTVPTPTSSRPASGLWSEGTRKGFVMVEMQAGGGRVCPRPSLPWAPDGQEIWPVKLSHMIFRKWVDTTFLLVGSHSGSCIFDARNREGGERMKGPGDWILLQPLCPWPRLSLDKS